MLIGPRVEVAYPARQLWRNDAIRGDEGIRQRCLAVVDVGEDANVSNAICGMLKLDELLRRDDGHGETEVRRAEVD